MKQKGDRENESLLQTPKWQEIVLPLWYIHRRASWLAHQIIAGGDRVQVLGGPEQRIEQTTQS